MSTLVGRLDLDVLCWELCWGREQNVHRWKRDPLRPHKTGSELKAGATPQLLFEAQISSSSDLELVIILEGCSQLGKAEAIHG